MTQGAKQVDISTYLEIKYVSGSRDGGGLTVNVTKDEPWDKLSKIFKRYTYAIDYSTAGDASQYNINVIPKSPSSSSEDKFQYKGLSKKVGNVEVFFRTADTEMSKADPLVVRFVYEGDDVLSSEDDCKSIYSSKCYYGWSVLKGKTENGNIKAESFKEQDLVTRLLEELGNTGGVSGRENKLVIRLNERPTGGSVLQAKYPGSGHYKTNNKQVTVKKARDTGDVAGVEGFEHTVGDRVNASEFYVSYNNDSRYFKIGSEVGVKSGSYLHSVTGYFETDGLRTGKLVLITFTFKKATGLGLGDATLYGYSYYDFFKELKKVDAKNATDDNIVKEIVANDAITDGDDGRGSGLKCKLQEEKQRLTPLISFETGNGVNDTNGNKNITTGQEQNVGDDNAGQGYKFKKYEMTPKISDVVPEGEEVITGGPWTVFSTKLFIDNKGRTIVRDANIQGGILSGVVTSDDRTNNKKYTSINVYYSTKTVNTDNYSDYKVLLVEFCAGNGDKKYIKRVKQDVGSGQWATDTISHVDDNKLTEIAKHAGVIVDSKTSSSPADNRSQGSQEGMSTGTKAGIGTGVGVSVGAGVGFAIYKNFGDLLSLIRR